MLSSAVQRGVGANIVRPRADASIGPYKMAAVAAVALFESSHGQHICKAPSRDTAGGFTNMGHEGLEPPTKRL